MDTNSNYAFMKSGDDINSEEYKKSILEKDVASFLIYFMDKSMCNMETYMKHHSITSTPIDLLKKCLKAEIFMYNNRPNYKKDIHKIKNEFIAELLAESDNDSECTEDTDTDTDAVTADTEKYYVETNAESFHKKPENGKAKTCDCALCKFIDNIDARWETWQPKSMLEHILKGRIEEIE